MANNQVVNRNVHPVGRWRKEKGPQPLSPTCWAAGGNAPGSRWCGRIFGELTVLIPRWLVTLALSYGWGWEKECTAGSYGLKFCLPGKGPLKLLLQLKVHTDYLEILLKYRLFEQVWVGAGCVCVCVCVCALICISSKFPAAAAAAAAAACVRTTLWVALCQHTAFCCC